MWEVLFHVLHRHTVLAEQCRVKEGVRFCLVLEALSLFGVKNSFGTLYVCLYIIVVLGCVK